MHQEADLWDTQDRGWCGITLLATGLLVGCGSDAIVDDFPGITVWSTVEQADGTPVSQGFVEFQFYNAAECGTPLWGTGSGLTDTAGRYLIQQEGPDRVPTGCLRVTARGGSDPLSEPTVSVDSVMQEDDVGDGELDAVVDLTLP